MPANSRIKFLASQILITTAEADPGAFIFEQGIVAGVTGTVLRSALIGDLTVDTLHLNNESVTLPGTVDLGSNFNFTVGGATWQTFMEDSFSFTAPAGSAVQIMIMADLFITGQSSVTPSARLLHDNTTTIDTFSGVADTATRNFIRFVILELTATGSSQSVNLKWQLTSSQPNNFSVTANAGSKHLRVAFKR